MEQDPKRLRFGKMGYTLNEAYTPPLKFYLLDSDAGSTTLDYDVLENHDNFWNFNTLQEVRVEIGSLCYAYNMSVNFEGRVYNDDYDFEVAFYNGDLSCPSSIVNTFQTPDNEGGYPGTIIVSEDPIQFKIKWDKYGMKGNFQFLGDILGEENPLITMSNWKVWVALTAQEATSKGLSLNTPTF